MPRRLEVALIDVGGTLWPNSWPIRQSDGEGRRLRVRAAMSTHEARVIDALVDDLLMSSKPGDEARTITTETPMAVDAVQLITTSLTRQGLPADPGTIARIRRAMAIPIHDRFQPLPGARALLEAIHDLGMRTFITSNTYWRDADSYRDDFRALGFDGLIDGIVTSIDAGHLKPHPAVFEMAMRLAGVEADQCVVIGNREDNDVKPAVALGMRSILVYPDDPKPEKTRADAAAPDLWACVNVLREMAA
ncbi:MAG TPA: HAD family hydrolase [Candidatus Dormibacteraeota bacterium]|nr:HAD family hydrolase [Candidatus Dormibacteraeota bacterium]